MTTISNQSNNTQVRASQNNAQIQQTNSSQTNETGRAGQNSFSVQEPQDSSEISVFNHRDEDGGEAEEYCYSDDSGRELPYSEEEPASMWYGDEDTAEAADYSTTRAAGSAGAEGAFAADEIEFAAETEAVDGEKMSVSEVQGDEYLQSPEYFERLNKLMKKQESCQILYQSLKNDDQKAYVKSHRDDYIKGKDLYDIMVEKDGRFNSKDEAKAYVDASLEKVQQQYTGRAAGCMSMLTIQEIAADYGVKLAYGHPHVEDGLAKNIDPCVLSDCCQISSWAFDKGCDQDMYWMNVKQLRGYDTDPTNYKNKEVRIDKLYTHDYSELQAGDSLTNGCKHAMYILYDNPEAVVPDPDKPGQTYKGVIIVAEAADEIQGVRLRQISYDQAKAKGYTGVDSSSVYDGSAACYDTSLKHH